MPDGFQELARAAAGNVVMAMGTEAWPTVRATLLDVLGRNGDPAPETWVDTFGGMIAGAEGREQNGLRDAAFARIESAFTGILAQRPDAAGDVARLVVPASPGQSGPGGPGMAGAPGAAQPLDFSKDSAPTPSPQPGSQPGAHSAPQSAPQGFPPPTPPQGMPPIPPGPPPSYGGSQPSGPPMGGPGGGPYAPPPQQGPYPQDQFQSGNFQQGNFQQGNFQQGNFQQGQFPQGGHQGPPPPMGHGGPGQHRNRPNSNKVIIGSVVAVAVVAGAVFGIVALTGDSDDEDCPTAAGAAHAAPMSGALAVGSDKCGGPGPGSGGSGSGSGGNSTGGDAKNTDTVTGPWTGTYENEVPAKLSGDFSLTLEQDGNRVTGDLDLDVAGCDLSGPVTGTMNGSKISLRSTGSSDTISLRGDLLGGRLTGKYTTTCNDASGSWKAEQG